MKIRKFLCRFPFNSGDGITRYRVMGDVTAAADVDFQVDIESLTDMRKLPFCADCSGELASAELIYGSGARKCMHCGSVYLVVESRTE
jgi:DNA-directed RNA polymerase subunit RPC12/RpoP